MKSLITTTNKAINPKQAFKNSVITYLEMVQMSKKPISSEDQETITKVLSEFTSTPRIKRLESYFSKTK